MKKLAPVATHKFLPVDIGRGILVPGYIWEALSEMKLGRKLRAHEKKLVCQDQLLSGFALSGRLKAEIGSPAAQKQLDELFAPLRKGVGLDDKVVTKDGDVRGKALVAY